MTYTHQSDFTYVYDKFQYFAEDFDCKLCASYKSRAAERDERFATASLYPSSVRYSRTHSPAVYPA